CNPLLCKRGGTGWQALYPHIANTRICGEGRYPCHSRTYCRTSCIGSTGKRPPPQRHRDAGAARPEDRPHEGAAMKKDFLSILDITKTELDEILSDAERLKRQKRAGVPHELLRGMSLAMIFEKSSTRTHISFEVGMHELGGHALFLNAKDLQIGRGEEIRDTARVTSRYVSGVMIRAYRHGTIEELAEYATIPVINGLSDREHPCQLLADILTIREHFGDVRDLSVAWIGDGNNVCTSLVLSSALTGMAVTVASPKGYGVDPELLNVHVNLGEMSGLSLHLKKR